jgi:NAD+ synthase (glutamine-hydrolysing)
MRIALCQINTVVGDLAGNAARILAFTREAAEGGAELAVFPEMCVTGYPPLDLLLTPAFVEDAAATVDYIAENAPREIGLLIGSPDRNTSGTGKPLWNAAIMLERGGRIATVHKVLLPTYDVFDEHRYFEPGARCAPVEFRGVRLGVHVCEDMWGGEPHAEKHLYSRDPITELAAADADLLVNISASPFAHGKHQVRNRVIEDICRAHGLPFVLVNQVGANTEILFDGDSRVHGPDGRLLRCAPSFEEHLLFWDIEHRDECSIRHDMIEDLHDALVMGIRDYFGKTGAFAKAVVGLSGGIDSAVTCALAVEALGAARVVGVSMPGPYSSEGSLVDARGLAENLGIECLHIPIGEAVEAFGRMLEGPFEGTASGVAEENIQARARGMTLMALSNKFDYLVLSTGNKSEMAVGYATLYGDMSGGLAVLADVFKQEVYRLARFMNERAGREIIPQSTITKPPSAELRPNQTDQDALPPYEVLDVILKLYVEELRDTRQIVHLTGFDRSEVERVIRMVDRSEYKRRQAPPGLRVSTRAFGIGRRMPIVMHRTGPAELARQAKELPRHAIEE